MMTSALHALRTTPWTGLEVARGVTYGSFIGWLACLPGRDHPERRQRPLVKTLFWSVTSHLAMRRAYATGLLSRAPTYSFAFGVGVLCGLFESYVVNPASESREPSNNLLKRVAILSWDYALKIVVAVELYQTATLLRAKPIPTCATLFNAVLAVAKHYYPKNKPLSYVRITPLALGWLCVRGESRAERITNLALLVLPFVIPKLDPYLRPVLERVARVVQQLQFKARRACNL